MGTKPGHSRGFPRQLGLTNQGDATFHTTFLCKLPGGATIRTIQWSIIQDNLSGIIYGDFGPSWSEVNCGPSWSIFSEPQCGSIGKSRQLGQTFRGLPAGVWVRVRPEASAFVLQMICLRRHGLPPFVLQSTEKQATPSFSVGAACNSKYQCSLFRDRTASRQKSSQASPFYIKKAAC